MTTDVRACDVGPNLCLVQVWTYQLAPIVKSNRADEMNKPNVCAKRKFIGNLYRSPRRRLPTAATRMGGEEADRETTIRNPQGRPSRAIVNFSDALRSIISLQIRASRPISATIMVAAVRDLVVPFRMDPIAGDV
jgi:hypothetical protein